MGRQCVLPGVVRSEGGRATGRVSKWHSPRTLPRAIVAGEGSLCTHYLCSSEQPRPCPSGWGARPPRPAHAVLSAGAPTLRKPERPARPLARHTFHSRARCAAPSHTRLGSGRESGPRGCDGRPARPGRLAAHSALAHSGPAGHSAVSVVVALCPRCCK